jgi:hypothetical protein
MKNIAIGLRVNAAMAEGAGSAICVPNPMIRAQSFSDAAIEHAAPPARTPIASIARTRRERAGLIWYLIPAMLLLGLGLFLRETRRPSTEFAPDAGALFTNRF